MSQVLPIVDAAQLDQMHALYRQGGAERTMAPHVIYQDASCPFEGCAQTLHAIDFRLNSLLKNAVVAFFNLAKRRAELAAARKVSVFQTLTLASPPAMTQARCFSTGC